MARNNTTTTTPGGARPGTISPKHLQAMRVQIDKLDGQILKLVNERASIAADIGRAKAEQGEDIFSPAREEEVLQNVLQANEKGKGPLAAECIRAIYRELISGSRALQKIL